MRKITNTEHLQARVKSLQNELQILRVELKTKSQTAYELGFNEGLETAERRAKEKAAFVEKELQHFEKQFSPKRKKTAVKKPKAKNIVKKASTARNGKAVKAPSLKKAKSQKRVQPTAITEAKAPRTKPANTRGENIVNDTLKPVTTSEQAVSLTDVSTETNASSLL